MNNILLSIVCVMFSLGLTLAIYIEPATKIIEIDEGGQYSIQFVEDDDTTKVTNCYYISDTLNGSFEVVKETNDTNVSEDLITLWGNSGICGFEIKNVNATVPRFWTIIAYDEISKSNFTENISVQFYHKISQLLNSISVMKGSSFIQHLTPRTDLQIESCIVAFRNSTIQLDMQTTKAEVISTNDEDSDVIKRLSSLGNGKCGFKMSNILTDDPEQWTIIAKDNTGEKHRAYTNAIIYDDDSTRNTQVTVQVGSWYYLSCGRQLPTEQYFCYLYDPTGSLVLHSKYCSAYNIEMVRSDHLGTWKCLVGIPESTETVEYTVELIDGGAETVVTWSESNNNYTRFGCRFVNSMYSSAALCEMVAPNGQTYRVQPGSATSRYTSLSTNLSELACGLEIEKPLVDGEKGMWACRIHISVMGTIVGDFIDVENKNDITYSKHMTKTIQLNEAFFIKCNVPFRTDYCSITAPNGTVYPTQDKYKAFMGECYLSISRSVSSDNGTWTCSFARETGIPDETIQVEITIAEVLIYYQEADVNKGDTAELICNSGGFALQYCRFISPNGVAYQLNNFRNTNEIDYYGAGLNYGNCGITIHKANNSHDGNWTCVTRLGTNFLHAEISATTTLRVLEQSALDTIASVSIGVAVAVIVLAGLFGGIKLVKHYKHKQTNLQNNEAGIHFVADNVSRASSESDIQVHITNTSTTVNDNTNVENNNTDQ